MENSIQPPKKHSSNTWSTTTVASTISSTSVTTKIPAVEEKSANSKVTQWRQSTKNGSLECFDSYGCNRPRIARSSDAESCVITIKFNKICETIDVFYSLLPNGAFSKWTPVADFVTKVRECWHSDCQLNKCIFFTEKSKFFNGTSEEVQNLVSLCALLDPLIKDKYGRNAPQMDKACQLNITSSTDNKIFNEGKKFNRRDVDVAFGRKLTSPGTEVGIYTIIIVAIYFYQ